MQESAKYERGGLGDWASIINTLLLLLALLASSGLVVRLSLQ